METINRKLRLAAQGLTAAALLMSSSFAVAQSAATIPAGMQGTYELTFTGSGVGTALLPNGTKLDLVIAAGGTSCIADHVLTSPTLESGNSLTCSRLPPPTMPSRSLTDLCRAPTPPAG